MCVCVCLVSCIACIYVIDVYIINQDPHPISIPQETLVEGLQRTSTRRTFRDSPYTKEDVVDL